MTANQKNPPSAEAVLRFLEDNPDFLITRGIGDIDKDNHAKVVSLNQTVIKRAAEVIRKFKTTRDQIENIHTANNESMLRAHQAAYLLMAATTKQEIITIIHDHFPAVLDIAMARLVVEKDTKLAQNTTAIVIAEATVLTPKGAISMGGDTGTGSNLTKAQQQFWQSVMKAIPPSAAFIPLPKILPDNATPIVLALAGKTGDSFDAARGTDLVNFIATLIAIALLARETGM